MKSVKVHTDGACRGNPGESGAGAVVTDHDGNVLLKVSRYLGQGTNNQAEYEALIIGLEAAHGLGADEVSVYADSELMVRQMKGEYKVKNPGLRDRVAMAHLILSKFRRHSFHHVPREKNAVADGLANEAIDKRTA